jgi:acetyl esterase/lipase
VFTTVGEPTAEEALATGAPLDLPGLQQLLADNSTGVRPLSGPILVAHGEADDLIPVALSEALTPRLCDAGADAELRVYPGADHGRVVVDSADDVLAWTADRFAGRPATAGCVSP